MSDDSDNFDRDSPYLAMKRDKYRINNLVGFGSETTNKNDWCPSNVCKVRLVVNRDGLIQCPECGRNVTKEQQQQKQEQKELKLQQNAGTPKSFVISQSVKTKTRKQIGSVNDSLTDEDVSDLRNMGINIS